MGKRTGKVFIDANMIKYAIAFRDSDIFSWINDLYEEIYIHRTVLDELVTNKSVAQRFIDENVWILFDPDDENCLSNELFPIYEQYEEDVKAGFRRLNEKKIRQKRNVKDSSDLGEIHSLAAALFLSANLISSNDYDIREVIEDEGLTVPINGDEEAELQLIIQDTVEDFCFLCVEHGIANKREVRKFLKVAHSDDEKTKRQNKVAALNQRLCELPD